MAVTQYIGARYVPLFAEPLEWNSSQSYEPLTIVYHAGNSYTSRQFVPSGIEINNEAYWALTGNYNAQIEQYREEVKQYDARISQNASTITAEIARAKAAEQAEEQRATAAEATKAPINHASEETIYGVGDAVNYGHLKLAVDDTPMTSGANDGVAATPKMISDYVTNKMVIQPVEFWGVTTENDATTNTRNLKNAMNDSAVKNITLLFGEGSYALNTCPLQNNITMIGVNKNKSIIDFSAQGYKAKGFYVPKDATDGNALVHDVTIKNLTIKGALPYTDTTTQKPFDLEWGDVDKYPGLEGAFFNCDISNIIVRKFATGIKTIKPDFVNNTYNYYNKKYGDNRLIRDVSILECVYGLFGRQLDFDYLNMRIYYTIAFAFNIVSCTLTNTHAWAYGSSNIVETCRMVNVEIEAPSETNNVSSALTIKRTVQVSNLFIWNSKALVGAPIYLSDRETNLIGTITFGAQYDTWNTLDKNIITGKQNAGATVNVNVLLDSNFTSITAHEPISYCNGVCNIVSKNNTANTNFAKYLTSNGEPLKKLSASTIA